MSAAAAGAPTSAIATMNARARIHRHDRDMRAMVLDRPGSPLREAELPEPTPGPGQLLVRVQTCGVCRTDLHVFDGELTHPKLPLVLGHQIVGTVVGEDRRVGIPWLGWTDGECRFCRSGRENLCDNARFTGYDLDASAHIIAQVARHEGRRVFAFTRPGDEDGQAFARELGAVWAGGSEERPPEELDAAIIFAPVGALVPLALRALAKGGSVVCAGIHMTDIPAVPYELLGEERVLRSVANLTRRDGEEFLSLAPQVPVRTVVEAFALEQANDALESMRSGRLRGSAVLAVAGE